MTTSDKVLANSSYELPSFSELIQIIEKDYQRGRNPTNSIEDKHKTYQSSFISQRTCSTIDNSTNRLKSLAHITSLKHYTSYETIRKREEELYSYFISFFSSLEHLFEKLKSIKTKLFILSESDIIDFDRYSDSRLFGVDKNGKQMKISRKDFRKWVMEIPSNLHCDIFEELNNMACNISKLSSIKKGYKEESILNNIHQKISDDAIRNNLKGQELQRKINLKTSTNEVKKTNSDKECISDADFVKYPFKVRNSRVQKNPKKFKKQKSLRQQNCVCTHCGTTQTPEWRKGPKGSRTLCNACGLFYSKLIKKFGLNDSAKILRYRRENKQISDRTIPCTLDM